MRGWVMSNRIGGAFRTAGRERALLISYATAYFPDRERSGDIIRAMLESGSDMLEIGIPFSDPLMDGPVIQEASHAALEAGASPAGVIEIAGGLRSETDKPILLMTYYNPVYRFGLDRFAEAAGESGVDGVIIPDIPLEEAGPWRSAASARGLDTVLFAAMNGSDERIREAGASTEGFLYCVAVLGTTGMRDVISSSLASFLERTSRLVDRPLAVGLGISTPEQCRRVGEMAQGVIVGSAYMNAVLQGGGPEDIANMNRGFRNALDVAKSSASQGTDSC